MAKNIEVNYDVLKQQTAEMALLSTELASLSKNDENIHISQGNSKDDLMEMYKELALVKDLITSIVDKTALVLSNINVSFEDVENLIIKDMIDTQ